MIEFIRRRILGNRMRMLWIMEKNDIRSYLLAATHFYPRPDSSFLRVLIPTVSKVIFKENVEGIEK